MLNANTFYRFWLLWLFALMIAVPVPTAQAAEEVLVYTAIEDDQLPRYLASWKQQHPTVTVKIVRDSTGIITAKLLAEKANPQADLIWGLAATSLLRLDQEGLLAPYAPKGLEKVLPQFKDTRNPPHWVGIDAWMTAFCVNTVESKNKNLPIPETYADLIKPVYKGHIVMPNPASSGTGYLTVSAILQSLGEQKGWEYLDKLHQNIAQYVHSGSKPCKQAGAGEFPVGISFDYRGFQEKSRGAPVATIFPKEGAGYDLEANGLIKKANIKPIAKTFLDWAISEPALKEYGKSYGILAIPIPIAVPEGYPKEPTKHLIAKNDLNWAAKNYDRILKEWTKRYDAKSEKK
jgi:iron(III) transport system substrate-binding protein